MLIDLLKSFSEIEVVATDFQFEPDEVILLERVFSPEEDVFVEYLIVEHNLEVVLQGLQEVARIDG